jgi:hypothetical protein
MYGAHPDYLVLFNCGSIGYFRCTIKSTGQKRSTSCGIALGHSDYTNGMMFWDPQHKHHVASPLLVATTPMA